MKFEWDENKNQINIKKHGEAIRMISARKATREEVKKYVDNS